MNTNDYVPGNTETLELFTLEKALNLKFRLFAKVENSNPTGSIKDRTVYHMLLTYQKSRSLEGATIIEATSGNTGIALSYYANVFHYRCIIVMPSSMSEERRKMISRYGAELVLTEGGMQEAENHALEMVKDMPGSFLFDQFNQPSNAAAHLETAKEIVRAVPDVKYVFAGIGTGGTITGIGKYAKLHHLDYRTIGIEPAESPLLSKGKTGPHLIQGIGPDFVPQVLDLSVLSGVVDVAGKTAIEYAKAIRDLEAIDCGISSGAALAGVLAYCLDKNVTEDVVCVFPDKGDRYAWN